MHVVMVAGMGLAALALFYFGAGLMGRSGKDGARLFIWVWLVASILNGLVGIFRAGIPLLNEIAAFVPIFGVPAAVAWFLAYRRGT
jgi:hypothetical protein